MSEPTIVVIAYNREHSLKRLLRSIAQANFPANNITLHISIDASDNPRVAEVANEFEWNFGEKVVEVKSENLGLLKHVLECGELTNRYASIIVLEDDLVVAPEFYNYGKQALLFFSEDEKIGGVSLYTYSCEENNYYPFQALSDGSDVHFIQVASSWGQAWTKNQWHTFKQWLVEHPAGKDEVLPDYVQNWGNNSWKKLFIAFLIDTDRYFAFPNTSYSSNFEDEGTHATNTGLLQVSMNFGSAQTRFNKWEDSKSVYDAFFELKQSCLKELNPDLCAYNFDVDLYGEKTMDELRTEFVLTSRRGRNPLLTFGSSMKPLIQNVVFQVEGKDLGIYRKEDIEPTEKNRFLNLYSAPSAIEHHAAIDSQRREHVSVIMPVDKDQLEALKVSFSTIPSNEFHEVSVILVCNASISDEVRKITDGLALNVRVIESSSSNIDDLFRQGIKECETDYCVWAQPGMVVNVLRLANAARIFQSMKQVQAFIGSQVEEEEAAYTRLSVADLRWTPQRARLKKEKCIAQRTEWVFWRKDVFSNEGVNELTTSNLFVQLLKCTLVYPVAMKFGDFNGVERSSPLSVEELDRVLSPNEFPSKTGLKSLLRPIFSFWFHRNVRFFRLFYRELEQLPLVVRFDFKHNSFYLDNY